jgi:hypothetical protein
MAQAESNAPAHVVTGQSFGENEANEPTHDDASPPPPPFRESPPAADPTPVQQTTAQPAEETAPNPQVVALQAIFPDFEPIILYARHLFRFRIIRAADCVPCKTIRSGLGRWRPGYGD